MLRLSMRQLRYFEALAQHGHFGRAATACSISQPALSQQIRELEDALGAPLVERGARRVRLTGLGEELAIRTRAILRAVDELDDLARAQRQSLTGRLSLGVIPTVAPYLLPSVVNRITTAYPKIDLTLREAVTQRLVGDLGAGRLDTAIVALPLSEPQLKEHALFDEDFVLVRPRSDANKPVPEPEALRAMRLLLLEEGHCFRDQALSYCHPAPESPRELMEGSSLTTLVQMVSAGIGVTLIPRMAVAVETRLANVSTVNLPAPRPRRTVGMVWRKASPLSAQFLEIARLCRALDPAGAPEPPSRPDSPAIV